MMAKSRQRILGESLVVCLMVVVIAGCLKSKPQKSSTSRTTPDAEQTGGGEAPRISSESAKEIAEKFLVPFGEGKATPAQVTTAFKKLIAPPQKPEEKMVGYSEAKVQEWLSGSSGVKFAILTDRTLKFANAIALRGRAESPAKKDSFAIRLVKEGSEYKLDWFSRSTRIVAEFAAPTDPDLIAAFDVALNFMDTLLGGDPAQTHSLMTTSWKKDLSPPTPPEIEKGLDYDPGFLMQKTRVWRGEYVTYHTLESALGNDKETAVFKFKLDAGGEGPDRLSNWELKLKKDKSNGQWLAEAYSKLQVAK